MYPRNQILQDNQFTHVFFRCHNRQFFLKDRETKLYLLTLWAKYRAKYDVKIYEFIIMDNHAHLIIKPRTVEGLSNFMRTVNSQLARYINKTFNRDSQALRERYKSPMITTDHYLIQTIQYVWLNRYKVDKSRPEKDIFCSASWRLDRRVPLSLVHDQRERHLLSALLSSYRDLQVAGEESDKRFVQKLLSQAIASINKISLDVFSHGHTIGDRVVIDFRTNYLKAFSRTVPP